MTYDPISLERLLTHQSWAMRLARRLVREEGEAEDLVQRTWIAALRRPPSTERGARAWLRKVILNLARERYRRDQARVRHERAGMSTDTSAPDAFELTSQSEICTLLGKQLLGLAEPYRTVLMQRYYEGLSSAEIARRLGIPSGTVRWRLKVGLDQMREELDRRSNGDRSRWVSALLLFAPPSAEGALDSEPPVAEAGAGGAGILSLSVWVGIALTVSVGLYFALRTDASRAGTTEVAALDVESGASPKPAVPVPSPLEEARRLASAPLERETPPEPTGLRVRVRDARGQPVAGARLFVAGERGFEERGATDATGAARLVVEERDIGALGLPVNRGRVGVRALAPGLAASELLQVPPPFTGEHEVELVADGPERVARGRVLDERGRPLGGARVAWLDALGSADTLPRERFSDPWYLATTSDGDGRFELANLPSRLGNLFGFAPGYALTTVGESGAGEVVLTLARGASVSGSVVGPDGRPVAGATLRFESRTKSGESATGLPGFEPSQRGFAESTRSDADGRFRIDGVVAGPRRLCALTDDERLIASVALELSDGVEQHWDAVLGEPTGVHLLLVDEHGAPLRDWVAHVRRLERDGTWWIRRQSAAPDGRVSIADFSDDEVYLDVFPPSGTGASYLSRRFRPGPDERRIEVDTRAPSSVAGRVVDAQGTPQVDGRLAFYAVRTSLTTAAERAADGSFEVQLAPGSYYLVLRQDEAALELTRLTLQPGDELDLGLLTLPERGTLRLEGARLHNGAARQPAYEVLSESERGGKGHSLRASRAPLEGEVVLSLFAGRYRVLAYDGAGSQPREYTLDVRPFVETRLELEP